ncbi:chromatin associated protein KTI12 [Dictyocaulus viviparus]|uniref:Chromatin associated protein KTI12 n=1 Tax=Dictyocaulus viviparus TaxID=29172 RepID=A0A0D8XS60_DICVI|nr:chromatin associated protein KTI12 [Dictyocaulus viviparus]
MALVLIMGLPAAGKTTLSKKIQGFVPDCVIFSLDDMNSQWLGDFQAHTARKSFENTVRSFLEQYCDDEFDKVIVLDDNFYFKSMRRPFERMAAFYGLRYCCVIVSCVVQDCLDRNSQRANNRVSNETILKMARNMEVPKNAIQYTGGDIREILEQLTGPRVRRFRQVHVLDRENSSSFLTIVDSKLRAAVAKAINEGLDGRRLAEAKKAVMNMYRKSKSTLSTDEIPGLLRKEYYHMIR